MSFSALDIWFNFLGGLFLHNIQYIEPKCIVWVKGIEKCLSTAESVHHRFNSTLFAEFPDCVIPCIPVSSLSVFLSNTYITMTANKRALDTKHISLIGVFIKNRTVQNFKPVPHSYLDFAFLKEIFLSIINNVEIYCTFRKLLHFRISLQNSIIIYKHHLCRLSINL